MMRKLLFGALLLVALFTGFQGGMMIFEDPAPRAPERTAAHETPRPAPARATEPAAITVDRSPPQPDTVAPAPERKAAPATEAAPAPDQPAPPQPAAAAAVPIDKMIGQMLVMGFQGTSADQKWPKRVGEQLKAGEIGGVIFLKHNVKDRARAIRLTRLFAESGAELPPLIAVDQEGGKVQRLSANVKLSRIPSAQTVARRRTITEANRLYSGVARSVRKLGFNTNLAPVADLNTNRANPIIGKLGRSFSRDPDRVVTYAREFVEAHRKEGVITALKHFPGHGSSRKDSHLGFVDISKTWNKRELEPFRRLIAEGMADMVMIGHLFLAQYQDVPGGKAPATFSKKLVTDVLRGELGYDGVVISDDLEMGAIRKHYKPREALRQAIAAGVDLLIVSNSAKPDVELPRRIIAWLSEDADKDPELARRIRESYDRILTLKRTHLAPGGMRASPDAAARPDPSPRQNGTVATR